jgi:uncharacterized damage-inducible protein DinB
MNTIEHLRQLYIYNDWANWRIISSLKTNSCEKGREILAHLLITEKEYFERLYGKDSTGFDFWQNLSLEECENLAHETAENYDRLLKRFDEEGLSLRAKYKTGEGVAYENTFRELLSHVLVHSATHRGNIVINLREEGFAPPKIDYIIYLRQTKYV